jgi:hypothetical protein
LRHPFLVATAATIVGGLAVVILLAAFHFINLQASPPQLKVTVRSPLPSSDAPNNTFGADGLAENVPSDMDLWLVVESGVERKYYPFGSLHVDNTEWNVAPNKICPALGSQIIQLYLLPKAADGSLYTYALNGTKHLDGIRAMPTDAVLEAQSKITVLPGDTSC